VGGFGYAQQPAIAAGHRAMTQHTRGHYQFFAYFMSQEAGGLLHHTSLACVTQYHFECFVGLCFCSVSNLDAPLLHRLQSSAFLSALFLLHVNRSLFSLPSGNFLRLFSAGGKVGICYQMVARTTQREGYAGRSRHHRQACRARDGQRTCCRRVAWARRLSRRQRRCARLDFSWPPQCINMFATATPTCP